MSSNPDNKLAFSGSPQKYLRIAIFGSILLNSLLYFGLAAIEYFFQGETWLLNWKPALLVVVFTAVFARIAYRWIMRLDAQFGSGKGWAMVPYSVKLPEQVFRKK
ncbi:MAG: hypothetical protein AB8B48_19845 [Pseudomonadales bacterium]